MFQHIFADKVELYQSTRFFRSFPTLRYHWVSVQSPSHTFMVVNVYRLNTGYFQSTFVFTGTTGPEIANHGVFALILE